MHMYTNLKNEDGVSPFSYPRPAHFLENDPSKRVYYSTSEEFANEFFKVLNSGRIQHFRDTFRALDVLLLDDIQFFEKVFGRGEGTVEEEFFHTFNKLQELGKQIIMISDKSPKEIKNLSKRLESRFLVRLNGGNSKPRLRNPYDDFEKYGKDTRN